MEPRGKSIVALSITQKPLLLLLNVLIWPQQEAELSHLAGFEHFQLSTHVTLESEDVSSILLNIVSKETNNTYTVLDLK